jgi:hypothetical protein
MSKGRGRRQKGGQRVRQNGRNETPDGKVIRAADLDRAGVTRHAEGFETPEECRERYAEIKARLDTGVHSKDPAVCVLTLRPHGVEGVPYWTVAVLATGPLVPPLAPRGQPVHLPDEVWALLLVRGYEAERKRRHATRSGPLQ